MTRASATIAYRLYIDWDFNGVYTDETAYFIQASGDMQIGRPDDFMAGGKGNVDSCDLLLRNASGRFSALNSSSPLYSYIQGGKAYHVPMYLEVSIDGGSTYSRIFTGVTKIPQEAGTSLREGPTVKITCRSNDELLLQKRQSTALSTFQTWAAGNYTEGDIIDSLLADAGVTSRAVDSGLARIQFAWQDDDSLLDDIWQMAAACGGRFYTDPDGVARYENMAHWLSHASSTETFTRDDFDQPLEATYDDSDLYNVVTVESMSRVASSWDTLWEPDEPIMVSAGETKKVTARLQRPIYATFGPEWQAVSAGGANISASVTVSATYYAQRVEFTITNSNAYMAAYMRKFKLMGYPVVGGPTHEESRNSADHGSNGAFFTNRGTRTRSVRSNPYIQNRSQAAMLALFLLLQEENPRLAYRMRGVPGVPARRLGDRVTLNDTSVMSLSRDAFIIGIAWRLTSNGFSQDITAIDAAQLYPYQSEGYFVVGTNTLGVSSKRVFY